MSRDRTEKQINLVKLAAPAYCEVANDGASWRCVDCQKLGKAEDMVFFATPDGYSGISHLTCLDEDWLNNATKVQGKI